MLRKKKEEMPSAMKKLLFLLVFGLCAALAAETEPFVWRAETEGEKLVISVRIAGGHYLNCDMLRIEVRDGKGQTPPLLSSPPQKLIDDPELGKIPILGEGEWRWAYGGTPPYQAKVSFQGCRKAVSGEPAVCLMPQELQLTGGAVPAPRLPGKIAETFYSPWKVIKSFSGTMNREEFLKFLDPAGAGETVRPQEDLFGGASLLLILLLTLLGGAGLNLTPCVLPMIPVNLAVISGGTSRSTGFRRGLCYAGGMALAYGVLGAVVVFTGATFGALNSSSWFNFGVAAVFFVLAAAMSGLFDLDLSRFARFSPGKLPGSREAAAFFMGIVSALLAGACVAPVAAGVMIFAAGLYAQGNMLAPFMGLLLGIGMGLPWPFAAAGLAVLPKPGRFMLTVKYVFAGVILLGAVYYAYLGFSLLPGKFSPQAELVKLEEAGARAHAAKKRLVVDFWATWCKNCTAMKRTVFKDPEVLKALGKYEFVEFQAEKPGDPLIAPLLKQWKVPGFPAFVILEP